MLFGRAVGRAARRTGLLAIRGVVAPLRVLVHPRAPRRSAAWLAFAYDFYFYKTDAPELCFAGDLCRALALYVHDSPRGRWLPFVATLATAVVTLAIPCWIIAARIPVISFCALFLYVLCQRDGLVLLRENWATVLPRP